MTINSPNASDGRFFRPRIVGCCSSAIKVMPCRKPIFFLPFQTQTILTLMETTPKLTDNELEEKYRDPDEIEESRIERLAQREADAEKEQDEEENNETVFL